MSGRFSGRVSGRFCWCGDILLGWDGHVGADGPAISVSSVSDPSGRIHHHHNEPASRGQFHFLGLQSGNLAARRGAAIYAIQTSVFRTDRGTSDGRVTFVFRRRGLFPRGWALRSWVVEQVDRV